MRSKSLAAVVAIVLVGTVAVSVTGQEDALPLVTARAELPAVILAVEPLHELQTPTLLEAALRNDYVSFHELYTAAKGRGENVSQFATLHELWTYSVTDPIGAFYGQETYEKLSRAFPGYASYIADYRIVDDRGNVFYPTSETRKFLVDQVIEGKTPRVQVADDLPIAARPSRRSSVHRVTPPVQSTPVVEPPVVIKGEPARAVVTPAPVPQPAPQVTSQPAQPTPQPIAQPTPAPQPASRPLGGRGILLLIIGLIGIGLLAVILRTPREEPIRIVQPEPPANVEPMRKTPPTNPPTDTRAAG